jgi:hypothetical protein
VVTVEVVVEAVSLASDLVFLVHAGHLVWVESVEAITVVSYPVE